MPDYRGHGDSEGSPAAGYGATEYVIDVLNALASLKQYSTVDPQRLGMWGHSLGGGLTLRAMVTVTDIKAGVIWAGVVGPYPDIIHHWTPPTHPAARAWHNGLLNEYGAPADDIAFWEALSPNAYITTISPVQLHHGTTDADVPPAFSETLGRPYCGVLYL
jgi:dipeptidyl aminopeptidase/acylaminoacyl peptidase